MLIQRAQIQRASRLVQWNVKLQSVRVEHTLYDWMLTAISIACCLLLIDRSSKRTYHTLSQCGNELKTGVQLSVVQSELYLREHFVLSSLQPWNVRNSQKLFKMSNVLNQYNQSQSEFPLSVVKDCIAQTYPLQPLNSLLLRS
jgi:hypothetical protein